MTVDNKDGSWGWCIVAASFVIHAIVGGIAYSGGIWQMIFVGYFQATRAQTAWLGSILLSLTALGGKSKLRFSIILQKFKQITFFVAYVAYHLTYISCIAII